MSTRDYASEIKRLEFAVRDLKEAARLESLGGPRRTLRAYDRRQSAWLWAIQVAEDLRAFEEQDRKGT